MPLKLGEKHEKTDQDKRRGYCANKHVVCKGESMAVKSVHLRDI